MVDFKKLVVEWLRGLGNDFDLNWNGYHKAAGWAPISFAAEALRDGKVCYELNSNGVVDESKFEDFVKLVEKYSNEMTLVRTNVTSKEKNTQIKKGSENNWTVLNEVAVINLVLASEDESSVSISTTDGAFGERVLNEFKPFFEKKSERPGRVHLLEASCDGMHIVDFGKGGADFLPGNYNEDVVNDFEFVKQQLVSRAPNGRLFILDGPPGTGKTYFVRGLLQEVTGAVFLLVPSGQIGSLTQPDFLPVIRRLHEQEEAPIVLILEDADQALVPRGTDNMSIVSDILNFADGIVGSIIDVRILATTNAKNFEIEPALRRKRRLGREVHVGALSSDKAEALYKRLTGQERKIESDKYTLAEVYALADGESEESIQDLKAQVKNRKTGF